MKSHTKSHRAPVRYSLRPEEIQEVISHLLANNKMTDNNLSKFSERFGCAKKTIHQIVTRHGCEVVSSPQPITNAKKRTTEKPDPPKSPPPVSADAALDQRSDPLDILIAEEARLRDEYEVRENEILDVAQGMESDLAGREARLAKQREVVRNAIIQTRNLRFATRADRELLEDLRGEIRSLTTKLRRAENEHDKTKEINAEFRVKLRASMKDQRLLLAALEQSEADLRAAQNNLDLLR